MSREGQGFAFGAARKCLEKEESKEIKKKKRNHGEESNRERNFDFYKLRIGGAILTS